MQCRLEKHFPDPMSGMTRQNSDHVQFAESAKERGCRGKAADDFLPVFRNKSDPFDFPVADMTHDPQPVSGGPWRFRDHPIPQIGVKTLESNARDGLCIRFGKFTNFNHDLILLSFPEPTKNLSANH